jgi:P-type Ca2+ transporter type 2C
MGCFYEYGSKSMQKPHVLTAENVLRNHATIAGQGLSAAEAAQRLNTHGPNELAEKGKKNAWRILLAQVKEVMIFILLAAVFISVALQEYIDAIVIFIIVVLNNIPTGLRGTIMPWLTGKT